MSTNQDWQSPPPAQPGMSGGTKLLLVLGSIGGLLALVCCGGFVAVGFWASRLFSNDPATVQERSQAIASIDVPASIPPVFALEIPTLFKFARFHSSETGAEVIVAERGSNAAGMSSADFAMQIEIQISSQQAQMPGHPVEPVTIDASTTRQVDATVLGAPTPFEFSEGTKRGQAFWRVTGEFARASGSNVWLRLDLPKSEYTEEQIVALLESIQEPAVQP